jgi:transketolase
MRNTFINAIIDSFQSRKDIYILSGDAGLGVFDDFKLSFPDKFLNLGVAEQNMAGFSAGLAMSGFKVFTYNIIPFVLYRCYEQIRNDICYQELPVVLVGIGSGLTYAPQGMTHYSVEDIGVAKTLPNLAVISPCDPVEARLAAEYALHAKSPVYVRLAKRGEPVLHENADFDVCRPQVLREGHQGAICFHGTIASEAIAAWQILSGLNMAPRLISIPMLNPLDEEGILSITKDLDWVICVEEHFTHCGLGAIMQDLYCRHLPGWKLTCLGIPGQFIHAIKDNAGMRKYFEISAEDLVKKVIDALGGSR